MSAIYTAHAPAPPLAPRPHIPLAYTVLLLYLEPLMALNGAYLLLASPTTYLLTFSPTPPFPSPSPSPSPSPASSPPPTYTSSHTHDPAGPPPLRVIYAQLAACYLLFAYLQAVVLRITPDLGVWKAIVAGMLMCDVVHAWAGWAVMAAEERCSPGVWRVEDWIAVGSLVIPGGLRVAFLMGWGVGGADGGERGVGEVGETGAEKVGLLDREM